MRLGIYGGSFDPVHNAHLAVARACQQQAGLDQVWFVPTAVQPLKHHGPQASDDQRIEMLRLAIGEHTEQSEPGGPPSRPDDAKKEMWPLWRVCTLEIDRGGTSYTVDTLRQIHEELPDAKLYFLMGADALRDVPQWREPEEIFRRAAPLVVGREGQAETDLSMLARLCSPENQPQRVDMTAMDISSSDIRRRFAAGESIAEQVPPSVAAYIEEHDVYNCAT